MRAQAAKLDAMATSDGSTRTPASTAAPAPVREEDAFDVEAVAAWLREHAATWRDGPRRDPEVRQFAGGASNLTYLLRYRRRAT